MENPKEDGSMPFLDNLVSLGPNNTLAISVYRKPTHTDQYLHWDSNHNLPAKHGVYNTFALRVGWFAQVNEHFNKRGTTLDRHFLDVDIPHGP